MSVRFIKKDSSGKVKEYDSGACLRGLNLLGHAQLIELEIGSTCGGHGKCGKDRIVLSPEDLKKINPPTEIEFFHLSKKEIAAGMRLGCQSFPNEDGLDILAHHEEGHE